MATISDSSSASYAEKARYDAAETERARAQEAHQEELNQLKEDFEEDKKFSNDEYNSKLMREKKEAAEEVRKLKEDLYNSEGKKFSGDSRDLSDEKAQLQSFRESMIKEYEDKSKRADEQVSGRIKTAEERKEEQIKKAMKEQNQSHKVEMKHLQDALRQATVDPRDLEKERAITHAQTIKDVEGPAHREKEYLVSAYEASMQEMRDKEEDNRDNNQIRLAKMQYETMSKANQLMREQKKDFIKRDRERQAESKQVQSDFKREISHLQDQSQKGTEVLRMNHENQTKQAMQNQSETINSHFDGQKRAMNYDLNKKNEELKLLKSTDNAMLASPALVQKIQKGEELRYYKQLQAEQTHNKNQEEGLRNKDASVRREMLESHQKELSDAQRQGTRKIDLEKSLLMTGYEDLKSSKEQEVQQLRDGHSTHMERTQLKHAQEVDLMQRRNMESVSVQRDSLSDENRRKLNEANFQGKVQSRELLSKMSSQRREFDNKLADAETFHQMEKNEMKLEFDSKLRDQERKAQKNLEERIQGYEHQNKEMELAHKEKIRILTERYEDEIDKMKRTNARLIQKKS